jgi:hypothetical protein
MAAHDSIKDAFEDAKEDFLKSLKDPDVYNFSKFTSINDVYDTTDKIQQEQSRSGTLQGLNRIRPYLDCLSQYTGVIEIFTQVKPDLLCLIWVSQFSSDVVGFQILCCNKTIERRSSTSVSSKIPLWISLQSFPWNELLDGIKADII